MFRIFRDHKSHVSVDVDIEKEARAVYRFIEHQGRRLKVIKLWHALEVQIAFALNIYSKVDDQLRDNYIYHRSGVMIDIEWKFKEIVEKEFGIPVLQRVKELADQHIDAIRRDYSQSRDAEDIHDIAKGSADLVIGEKEHFNHLMEMINFRREREEHLAELGRHRMG